MSKRKTARFLRAAYHQMLRAARELTQVHLEGRIEALVFAAPLPMTVRDLARVTGARRNEIETALAGLVQTYAERGMQLVETSEGFSFLTNPLFGQEVRAITGKKPVRMSRAQLETLAVIAYRQPVTRPEIDDVRGVDSGPVLRTLLDRELIRVIGKKEEPGRPLLYGTTDEFLKLVNIKSLAELPTLREFTELSDDSRDTYERKLGEAAPAGAIVFDDEPDEMIDPTAADDDEDEDDRGSDAPASAPTGDADGADEEDDEDLDEDEEDDDEDLDGADEEDADGADEEDDEDLDEDEEDDDEDLDGDDEEDDDEDLDGDDEEDDEDLDGDDDDAQGLDDEDDLDDEDAEDDDEDLDEDPVDDDPA